MRPQISLGGAAGASANLQIQTRDEAKAKDVLERQLHASVCRGTVGLRDAQLRLEAWRP